MHEDRLKALDIVFNMEIPILSVRVELVPKVKKQNDGARENVSSFKKTRGRGVIFILFFIFRRVPGPVNQYPAP